MKAVDVIKSMLGFEVFLGRKKLRTGKEDEKDVRKTECGNIDQLKFIDSDGYHKLSD